MQYALLIYNDGDAPGNARGPVPSAIAAALARPDVSGWIRLHEPGSATTMRPREDGMLLTDGPFVDSKEYLAGLVIVEADNLDEALAAAAELQEARPGRTGAIEIRPMVESGGA